MNVIAIADLGKAYAQYPYKWARLFEWLDPWSRSRHQLHWVLKNFNLQINAGQGVAIIGMNGAGKSTLLKLIAKTMGPTVGTIQVHGDVAALLELGMGFHPDFTGRENVKMAAQLLGIKAHELIDLMPQIEAFADIGQFIDQPFRIYSSGMQVRLAFSVATAKRPDILIVDEALAVGDSAFQEKCFSRIRSFREQGTTLLLVSHDQSLISRLCDRVILLDKGAIIQDGEPGPILEIYNDLLAKRNTNFKHFASRTASADIVLSPFGDTFLTAQVQLCSPLDMTPLQTVAVGQSVALQFMVPKLPNTAPWILAFEIKNRFGKVVFATHSECEVNHNTDELAPRETPIQNNQTRQVNQSWRFVFDMNLSKGQYSISVAIVDECSKLDDRANWHDLAVFFEVVNLGLPHFEGHAWLNPKLTIAASNTNEAL